MREGHLEIIRRKAQPLQDLAGARFVGVTAIQLKVMFQPPVALDQLVQVVAVGIAHLLGERDELGFARAQLLKRRQHFVPQGALGA